MVGDAFLSLWGTSETFGRRGCIHASSINIQLKQQRKCLRLLSLKLSVEGQCLWQAEYRHSGQKQIRLFANGPVCPDKSDVTQGVQLSRAWIIYLMPCWKDQKAKETRNQVSGSQEKKGCLQQKEHHKKTPVILCNSLGASKLKICTYTPTNQKDLDVHGSNTPVTTKRGMGQKAMIWD